MNPASKSSIELGTIEHPFKHIHHANIEINLVLNNRTDLNVRLFLAEKNRHDCLQYGLFIENLNRFEMVSYSPDP